MTVMTAKPQIGTGAPSVSNFISSSQSGTKLDSSEGSNSELPGNVLELLLRHLFLLRIRHRSSAFDPDVHFCSLAHPCQTVWLGALLPILSLRLVSSSWNVGVQAAFKAVCHNGGDNFFKRVEDAYYPYVWHINTKVRRRVILGRFRIFRTISSEDGNRGVYLAYDFGSSNSGCLDVDVVVIKAWLTPDDSECVTERAAYRVFRDDPTSVVPKVIISAQDSKSGVYAVALQNLGPTLEDLVQAFPGKRLNEKMVLAIAIQLLECYYQIHSRRIIHNGVKPANICLPPSKLTSKVTPDYHLYTIDFGFSSLLTTRESLPDGCKADIIGNRHFLSVFGHHGITLSQRDDLESLAYLLSFLAHGFLPWTKPSPRKGNPKPLQPQLWRLKMSTSASILFHNMDQSFIEFWKDVKGLAFGEMPDYDIMAQRFVACWERKNYGGCPGDIDWAVVAQEAGVRANTFFGG